MAKSAAPKAAFHSHANGLLQGYVSLYSFFFLIQFYVHTSTYTDKMYILHQNSMWPYRHKHINVTMSECRPVSVYTGTQDFQNSLPQCNSVLLPFFHGSPCSLLFQAFASTIQPKPIHSEKTKEKMLTSMTFQTLLHFYKIHMSL